jgi:hypothetical protein
MNLDEANIEASIAFNWEDRMPYVIFCTTKEVMEGEELFLNWGEPTWKAIARIQMTNQACVSHMLHLRINQLEEYLSKNGITPTRPRSYDDDEDTVIAFDSENQTYYTVSEDPENEKHHRLVTGALLSKISSKAAKKESDNLAPLVSLHLILQFKCQISRNFLACGMNFFL